MLRGAAENGPVLRLGLSDEALVEEATSHGACRGEYAF